MWKKGERKTRSLFKKGKKKKKGALPWPFENKTFQKGKKTQQSFLRTKEGKGKKKTALS